MFEDVRRAMAHRRAAREAERLKKLERGRRMSYISMKRLEERKSVEEGLREQVGAELSAHEAAKQALRARKQMERELRTARGPGTGMRAVRSVGRATKSVLYDLPVKSIRLGAKLSKGPALQKALVGDFDFVFGKPKVIPRQKPPTRTPHELIFGSPTPSKPKDKSLDVLG